MIGGSGERKTLHTVAKYADGWNTGGDVERVRHKDEVLRRWCDEVGRDESEIERTLGGGTPVIRDTESDARKVVEAMAERNKYRDPDMYDGPLGPPELVAEAWAPTSTWGSSTSTSTAPRRSTTRRSSGLRAR
jgi:alkanesulfonate monooxygenase SsuD/methylene tetrahydromethanopterin reductase-like flavin-dependent oxidoreductase (luciferase family)